MKSVSLLMLWTVVTVNSSMPTKMCKASANAPEITYDWSNKQVQHIPRDIPLDVTKLMLASNDIQTCDAHSFKSFKHLRYLNLANNSISSFHENCFAGLKVLEYLNLENNSFKYDAIPMKIFGDLHSLQTAHGKDSYPGIQLESLTCLRELVLSGIEDQQLQSQFKNLTFLVFIGTGSNLKHISQDVLPCT